MCKNTINRLGFVISLLNWQKNGESTHSLTRLMCEGRFHVSVDCLFQACLSGNMDTFQKLL